MGRSLSAALPRLSNAARPGKKLAASKTFRMKGVEATTASAKIVDLVSLLELRELVREWKEPPSPDPSPALTSKRRVTLANKNREEILEYVVLRRIQLSLA